MCWEGLWDARGSFRGYTHGSRPSLRSPGWLRCAPPCPSLQQAMSWVLPPITECCISSKTSFLCLYFWGGDKVRFARGAGRWAGTGWCHPAAPGHGDLQGWCSRDEHGAACPQSPCPLGALARLQRCISPPALPMEQFPQPCRTGWAAWSTRMGVTSAGVTTCAGMGKPPPRRAPPAPGSSCAAARPAASPRPGGRPNPPRGQSCASPGNPVGGHGRPAAWIRARPAAGACGWGRG